MKRVSRTALITGTTSGIGYEFAKQFAADAIHLVLVSRNREKLMKQQEALSKEYAVRVDIIAVDLAQADAIEHIREQLEKLDIDISYLVNNAGFNEVGPFLETNIEKEKEMIQVHNVFVTELTKYLLPKMIKNNDGKIANIGSTGSYIPCPHDAVYAATKAYILFFSKALAVELKNSGVSVSLICPGATKTAFAEKANIQNTLLFKLFVMEPAVVAHKGYKAMMRGKKQIIVGLYNKVLVITGVLLPNALVNMISKKMLG